MRCRHCRTDKPETDFYVGRGRCCKQCHQLKVTQYYHRSSRKFRYRGGLIPVDEYDRRLSEQCFVCAVCKKHENPNGKAKRLSVDHDHKTGYIRGLLCRRCNLTLGYVKDDINLLTNLANYIRDSIIRQGSNTPE